MSWPWSELGLPGPAGLPEIRRAYAQRLKTTHPEEDPEGFQRLHTAYQEASRYARRKNRTTPDTGKAAPESPRDPHREDDAQEASKQKEEREWDYDELLKSQQRPQKPPEKTEHTEEPDWDYDELLKNEQGPQKPPEKTEHTEEPDWDYDELLKSQQGPQKPPEKTEHTEEPDWDYDELLKNEQGPQKPPEKTEQAKESDWDYDELLKERQDPKKPPEAPEEPEEVQGPDWDYERLFAEGEEEAQQARRRKMEELRQKNRARYTAQEQEQRKRAADEEETWTAVMAATHALELLYSTGAPLNQWARFLNDPVFWNVRANLDFVFALEDFIEQHTDLSQDIRKAIFSAYGFEKGLGNPVYWRLYRLLNVGRKEKRRMARSKSAWRARWRSFPLWRKIGCVICLAILLVFFAIGWGVNLQSAYRDFTERRASGQWEKQSLEWLEEDFGEPFTRPLPSNPNLYAPAAEPNLYFWVLQDGEREGRWPGYRTDYPHIRVMQAMKDFAAKWDLGLELDSAGGFSGNLGDAPGAYLFDLPLEGAGEAVAALGELITELKARNWYRILEDQYDGEVVYQVFLCHKGLSFYDAVINREGGFDADYARARYETQAGPAFCRYLLEESGLAEQHLGKDAYVLLDQGVVEISGGTFYWVSGLDKESYEPRAQYLLASGGHMLFCLPGGGVNSQTSASDLYRGRSDTIEVKDVGFILVQDQLS